MIGLVGPAILLGCADAVPRRPDLWLFTVDTVRADHLEIYGHARPTAPWIASIARDGVVFDAASATSSWTVPSMGSVLTGLLPHQLGLEQAPSLPGPADPRPRLPDTAITLAERLSRGGYRTFAVTANAQLGAELGYGQGFDRYVNVGFSAAGAVRSTLRALSREIRESPQPVFVWVHLFDPHDPYDPDPAWLDQNAPTWDEYGGPGHPGSGAPPLGSETMDRLRQRADLAFPGEGTWALEALYDGEIARADAALGEIAADLDVGSGDVVVVAGDHGEEFRDHGELGHRVALYEETLRVPLVVRWIGRFPAHHVTDRVSLAALAPTLAALGGSPVGAESGLPYGSLVPELEGRSRARPPPVVAELVRADGHTRYRALYDGTTKLVSHVPRPGGPRTLEVFDLAHDPAEESDLAVDRPDWASGLSDQLHAFLDGLPTLRPEVERTPVPVREIEELEAMGYVDALSGSP